jgi:hypothetical protein
MGVFEFETVASKIIAIFKSEDIKEYFVKPSATVLKNTQNEDFQIATTTKQTN